MLLRNTWLFILLLWTLPVSRSSSAPVFDHTFLQIKEIKNWNQGRPGNEDIMDIANSKIVSLMYAFLSSIVQLGKGYKIILQTLCLSLSYINQTTTSIQHHLCSTYRALWELAAVCLSLVSGRVLAAQGRYSLYSRQLLSFVFALFRLMTSQSPYMFLMWGCLSRVWFAKQHPEVPDVYLHHSADL